MAFRGRECLVFRVSPGTANRYNLTVAHVHTYYVLAGNTPILVHNCGGAGVTNGRPHSTSCACASGAPPRIPNNPYGGRGKPSTQAQLNDIHDELMAANPDWIHVAGGSLPERNIVGPGGVPRRADLEYKLPDGSPFFVNTVTTYADGVTATSLELANAIDIMMWGRGPVLMIPKIP
ncbi:hypothetical protein NYE86_08275 [Actinacidiphila bryophytorum]|nr:hypothetical protein [Actinacidiphila bryophytorum]UWE13668.1 hypothetical protein NYE86_08275 [Actinacidiphila bryophytorum]